MKRLIATILVVCLICAVASCLFACEDKTEFAADEILDTSNWMRGIEDSALLSSFSIVGTHDSGAYQSGLYYSLGQDQTYNIANQLLLGARFLDIRLKLKKDKLKVYHGIVDEKLTFDEVVQACKEFLQVHQDECILMCVKNEDDSAIAEAVHSVIDQDSALWYTKNAIPTLGEVRGKIVLFRRFEDSAAYGVDLYSGFRDNCAFAIDGDVRCYVQDYYKLGTTDNLPAKWEIIQQTFAYSISSAQDEYVINFTSAYYDKKLFGKEIPEIKKTADYIHEQYRAVMDTLPKGNYGIVLFDFVDKDIAQSIIATNA